MKTALLLAQESKCVSYKVAAIIVKNERIISMGYNGTPPGTTNCRDFFDKDNFDRSKHREWSGKNEIHAEMNAISFAAKNGIETECCDMYVTLSPCNDCLKTLVMAGIKNLYYFDLYDYSDLNPIMLEQINVNRLNADNIQDFIIKLKI